MIKVGVIGATGYSGIELVSILLKHPKVSLDYVTSNQYVGKDLVEVHPFLKKYTNLKCQEYSLKDIQKKGIDLIFLALPHGHSMKMVPELIAADIKVIDLAADYRFKDASIYSKWYGFKHEFSEILLKAQYGLPELFKENIEKSHFIANPGCYPTASILALAPLFEAKIEIDFINIDAKSGVSGAGRNPSLKSHFPECNENVFAYKVGKHQHTPEIEKILSDIGEKNVSVNFVPHLIPVNRGILATHFVKIQGDKSLPQWKDLYEKFYKDKYFVRVCDEYDPNISYVINSNFCDLGIYLQEKTNTLIVIATLDNLVKGAAGQAVQNMNLILGCDEEVGLI